MTAIPREERHEHSRITQQVVSAASDIRDSDDGVVMQFDAEHFDSVVRFISRERLCCPFLRFTLDVAPDRSTLSLGISGPAGAGQFVRAELHLPA